MLECHAMQILSSHCVMDLVQEFYTIFLVPYTQIFLNATFTHITLYCHNVIELHTIICIVGAQVAS